MTGGAVISPFLSNIFLDPLDKLMERKGFEMVRYADDFVVLCEMSPTPARHLTSSGAGAEGPDSTCILRRPGWLTPAGAEGSTSSATTLSADGAGLLTRA